VDRRSVSTWIDRWQTRGLVGLSDKPGSGRRPLLNDEEQQKVHDYLHHGLLTAFEKNGHAIYP